MKIYSHYKSPLYIPPTIELLEGDIVKAQQQFKEECDVNTIVASALRTGILVDPLKVNRSRIPEFRDSGEYTSYHEMQSSIATAKSEFEALPAATREAFGNDPGLYMAYLATYEPSTDEELPQNPVSASDVEKNNLGETEAHS